MTLIDAPAYDPTHDNRVRNLLLSGGVLLLLAIVLGIGGYALGHGWFFSNLPAEHKVNSFYNALEAKDFAKAYGIYQNDPDWQQHPQKYTEYPLNRFTEDWTTHSPVNAPITEHHIDISRTDGSGMFGTGIIVAAHVNGPHKVFVYVNRADGTMTWPAPHELRYGSDD
jgi:hypothetical protein